MESADFGWINLGRQAFGVEYRGRLVAVLYWAPADVGEVEDLGGEPIVTEPGFFLVQTESPTTHLHVVDGEDREEDWARALAEGARRLLIARGYDVGDLGDDGHNGHDGHGEPEPPA